MKTGDDVDKVLEAIKKLDKQRQAEVDKLMALQGNPREVNASDSKALSANIEALANGSAVAVFPAEKRRDLKPWEIDKSDAKAVSANMREIAAGRKLVVDPLAPEPVLSGDQISILRGA